MRLCWLLFVLTAAPSLALASTVIERSAAERYEAADQIVVGSVSDVAVRERSDTLWTDVTVAVDQVLLGDREDTMTVAFWGGQLEDGRALRVNGMPTFIEGDRVLLFLVEEEGRASATTGLWQGAFKVTQRGFENARGETLTVDDEGVISVSREAGDAAAVVRALAGLRDEDTTEDGSPSGVETGDRTDDVNELEPGEAIDGSSEESEDDSDGSSETAPAFTLSFNTDDVPAAASDAAEQLWREAGVNVGVTVSDDAADRIEIGPPERFDRGIVSLSLRDNNQEGSQVLLNPNQRGMHAKAIATELAFLAGVQTQTIGWLSGTLPVEASAQPLDSDAEALRAALGRIPEDVNGDGVVDFYDLVQVASSIGETGPGLVEDINDSGTVDQNDLDRLEDRYEFTPASPDGSQSSR